MTWIMTTSGRRFDYLKPTVDMVDPTDIVTASARIHRFTGHGRHLPLDLNQHHWLVHDIVRHLDGDDHEALDQALIHDAHEVYVGDVNRPLKIAMRKVYGQPDHRLSPFDKIEFEAAYVVAVRFNVDPELQPVVKQADNMALAWEARWLFGDTFGLELPPFTPTILEPAVAARRLFDWLVG